MEQKVFRHSISILEIDIHRKAAPVKWFREISRGKQRAQSPFFFAFFASQAKRAVRFLPHVPVKEPAGKVSKRAGQGPEEAMGDFQAPMLGDKGIFFKVVPVVMDPRLFCSPALLELKQAMVIQVGPAQVQGLISRTSIPFESLPHDQVVPSCVLVPPV